MPRLLVSLSLFRRKIENAEWRRNLRKEVASMEREQMKKQGPRSRRFKGFSRIWMFLVVGSDLKALHKTWAGKRSKHTRTNGGSKLLFVEAPLMIKAAGGF